MPRPLRVHLPGALYHVMCRGMTERPLFMDPKDYHAYLSLVAEYRERTNMKLFAYVLLPDHVRLCLELTNATTISTIMHGINSRYTKYYGKRHGHAGHVFQERFKLTVLEKAPSLLRVTGYLHTDPVRCAAATDVGAYAWSSASSYLAARPSSSLELSLDGEVQEVLERLAQEHPGMAYAQFLSGVTPDEWEALAISLERPVVGSEAFQHVVATQQSTAAQPNHRDVPVATTDPGVPQPRPSSPRPRHSLALTASVAVMVLSTGAALLWGSNLSAMRHTIDALIYERTLQFRGVPATASTDAVATMAAFDLPLQLEGAEADVEIRSITGTADPFIQKEHLGFRDGKLISRALGSKGFAPANYMVTAREGRMLVWETVQADRQGTFIYWRGEWDGQTMRGTLTRQAIGKSPVMESFVGTAAPAQHDVGPMKET